MLTSDRMTRRSWAFGPLHGPRGTTGFRFAANGLIEGYSHFNEYAWRCEGGVLGIYRQNGELMWRSERILEREQHLQILLACVHPDHPTLVYSLDERSDDGRTGMAEFLFPSALRRTPTSVSNVLFIGSCLSLRYVAALKSVHPSINFDFILFNNVAELPAEPPAPAQSYDFQYIQLPLRFVLGDRVIQATNFSNPAFAKEVLDEGRMLIDLMLESTLVYSRAHGVPAFVANFVVPQASLAPSLDRRGGARDLARIISELNHHLADRISDEPNAFLCDVDSLAASFGKRFFLDDITSFSSHNSIVFQEDWDMIPNNRIEPLPQMHTYYDVRSYEIPELIFEQAVATLRTLRQMDQVKAVVFDLDNTLWRGLIAEDYAPGRQPPHWSEWQIGLWDAIQHLRARGVLVAACSKNDIEIVKQNWDRAIDPPFLKLEDFVTTRINWRPKPQNILEICEELSIKPKSVVFVDDNPIERQAVREALPDIRVLGSNPYVVRRTLLWAPETQIPYATSESQQRETAMRGQIERETLRLATSREAFLKGLGTEVVFLELEDAGDPHSDRVLELTNKTNQFNTTGKRWSAADLRTFLAEGGRVCAFRARDRFADYGLIGVIYAKDLTIEQMVMSCRVLGMDIENAAVAFMLGADRDGAGERPARGVLVETTDNGACRDLFPRLGFAEVQSTGGVRRFVLDAGATLVTPSHIRVTEGT
jgi:FkbH-like protein